MSLPTPDAVDELVCSARGCRREATWGVLWNNPRLHTPVRRKVWLACDDHRAHLEEYLQVRDFWKQTVPVADLPRIDPAALGDRGGPAGATGWVVGTGRFGGLGGSGGSDSSDGSGASGETGSSGGAGPSGGAGATGLLGMLERLEQGTTPPPEPAAEPGAEQP